MGLIVKTEDILHKVGTSERTKAIIEPDFLINGFLRWKI